MSLRDFQRLINDRNTDVTAWVAAIRANPNTPEDAFKMALLDMIQVATMKYRPKARQWPAESARKNGRRKAAMTNRRRRRRTKKQQTTVQRLAREAGQRMNRRHPRRPARPGQPRQT